MAIKEIQRLTEILTDDAKPISQRMNATFALKAIGSKEAINSLNRGFTSTSNLLTHEIAYVLGQMQNPHAVPFLRKILSNRKFDSVTRHEAAEALAAIGDSGSLALLKQFEKDPDINVRQTCTLAIDTIRFKNQCKSAKDGEKPLWPKSGRYNSVDPAPPSECGDIVLLEKTLTDPKKSLFSRYSALFRLREMNTETAVEIVERGFGCEGALFKHEIAYVLGQMQNERAFESLESVLRDSKEHPMVRHEAAEAIGSISGKRAKAVLEEFTSDEDKIVSESCFVALDMAEFWTNNEAM